MNNLNVYRHFYIHGKKIIETDQGKFFIVPRCSDKEKTFHYLESKKFPFFLPMEKLYRDSYEVYRYVEDTTDIHDKSINLVHILSLLHIKTTTYQEIVLDYVKKLYEDVVSQLDSLFQFYQNLQENIETHIYMSPDEYLFIRNISLFYQNLEQSRHYLELWYQNKKMASKERVVFLHGKPCLDTFIDCDGDSPYFMDWDFSQKGYVIYDFLYFYKKNCLVLEMQSLFQIYQSKYPFSEDEMYLFLCLILLDEKIDFTSNYYENTVLVQNRVSYAFKTRQFVLEQNQKNQEANQEEFNE